MEEELVKKAQMGCMHSYGILVSGIKEQAYRITFCYLGFYAQTPEIFDDINGGSIVKLIIVVSYYTPYAYLFSV
jgi:hypothetical protein